MIPRCFVFFALDTQWEQAKDETLGDYLSNANPFLFADIGSADPAIYYDFCDFTNNKAVTVENSFDIAESYINHLGNKTIKAAFENIEQSFWIEVANKYLSEPHKGDNLF